MKTEREQLLIHRLSPLSFSRYATGFSSKREHTTNDTVRWATLSRAASLALR